MTIEFLSGCAWPWPTETSDTAKTAPRLRVLIVVAYPSVVSFRHSSLRFGARNLRTWCFLQENLVSRVGIEPTTRRLREPMALIRSGPHDVFALIIRTGRGH